MKTKEELREKQCTKCGSEKLLSEFPLDKRAKDGRGSWCKECSYKITAEWRRKNRKHINGCRRKWAIANKERLNESRRRRYGEHLEEMREYNNKYWKLNGHKYSKIRNRQKTERRRISPKLRLSASISRAIWGALNGEKNGRMWEELVGYKFDDLKIHLEQQFSDEMSWDNYGKYWSLDHIRPQSWFSYESANDEEFRQCWALNNLKPMERIENIKKGARYEG